MSTTKCELPDDMQSVIVASPEEEWEFLAKNQKISYDCTIRMLETKSYLSDEHLKEIVEELHKLKNHFEDRVKKDLETKGVPNAKQ